jgi:hypothetical protein
VKVRIQVRRWSALASLVLILGGVSLVAQNRRNDNTVPRPPQQSSPRNQSPHPTYPPPKDGHHSGQWLNQHRTQSLDEQKRALERDPAFRRLPPENQQRFVQRLQHFDSLPPERQEQVIRRMHTWEHLTPQQKQDFRGLRQQFNGLPADRRQAVKNAIESLRAMPPAARQRELESGRFSEFSPQEREILNGASRLPLAPASPSSGTEAPNPGTNRYVPRPPQ